jgi:hypothetical protein
LMQTGPVLGEKKPERRQQKQPKECPDAMAVVALIYELLESPEVVEMIGVDLHRS